MGVLLHFHHEGQAPSLREAAAILGVDPDDVDPERGVVPVDPVDGLYAIEVSEAAVSLSDIPLPPPSDWERAARESAEPPEEW